MGHELKVFSFLEDDFHGYSLIGMDQEYVIICYSVLWNSDKPKELAGWILERSGEVYS